MTDKEIIHFGQEPVGEVDLHKELGQLRWMGGDEGWDNAIHAVRKRLEELYAAPVSVERALKLAEEALKSCEAGNWSMSYDELAVDEALATIRAAQDHIRDATKMVKCNCGDIYPADSFGAGFIAATGRCQNCCAAEQAEQEPVAVISESAIGLVKLHSNGVSLPFGTKLYAAPVQQVDLTDDEIMDLVRDECVDMRWPSTPLFIARAVIAKFKEKNK